MLQQIQILVSRNSLRKRTGNGNRGTGKQLPSKLGFLVIEVICDHLEPAADWQIKRGLLINVLPRHMKSLAARASAAFVRLCAASVIASWPRKQRLANFILAAQLLAAAEPHHKSGYGQYLRGL
jgi:hypothetical protein